MTGSGAERAAPEARWLALWTRVTGGRDGRAEFDELARRYAEPARHYHTLDHILHCLDELERARGTLQRPDEAELAVWLHDAVYDPRAADNETRSAELADRMLAGAGVDAAVRARVETMIMATTHHPPAPEGDAAFVCDADLAILGAAPADYARYAEAVRKEYGWVPAPLFRRGRAGVLRSMLERPFVYATPEFRARYETTARRNLSGELAELGR